ncbi:MAG: amino acid adenylation domain-containing protein [Ginsengibacter sp.]
MIEHSDNTTLERNSNFSKAVEILYSAKQSGIRIELEDDQLQLSILEDKNFDENCIEEIKNNKQLIIEFLRNSQWKSEKVDKNYNKIKAINRQGIKNIPLSFSQERLWFIDQLEGSTQYHIPEILRLKGKLNRDALQYALESIVNRHEVLRTVLRSLDGKAYQHIKEPDKWKLTIVDGLAHQKDKEELQRVIGELIKKPFNLSQDNLLRGHLIQIDNEEHILIVTLHHIVSDGWSKSILVKEVAELYTSFEQQRPPRLKDLEIQYADYAIWQREFLQGDILEKKLSYWKEKLEGVGFLAIPTDYIRPPEQSNNGAIVNFRIDAELSEKLQVLSKNSGTTLFMTLLAGLNVLLHRYSGQNDICIGTPIAGRQQPEVENLIGFFINTLALRNEIDSDDLFGDLLQQIKTNTLEAYNNQEIPFEKVVDAVVKQRNLSHSPLFQVMLVLQNTQDVKRLQLGDLTLLREDYKHTNAKFDLSFTIIETADGLKGIVQFCTDLFKEGTVKRMAKHFSQLLESMVKEPSKKISELTMLSEVERQEITEVFNNTSVEYPRGNNIINLFEQQAAKTPDNIALVFEESRLTYRELNERTNQLAYHLKNIGVKEEILVPVCIERGPAMLIAILSILKSGGAYVPIDPEYPQDRIKYMFEDTCATVIITSRASIEKLPKVPGVDIILMEDVEESVNNKPIENVDNQIKPGNLAYVIYTSGSTGKPKGVMIEHRNVYSFINWCKQEFSQDKFDILYASTSMCFDLSVFEFFYPLTIGKPIRLLENGLQINKYLDTDTSIMLNTVPVVIESLLKEGAHFNNVSSINMAGEPIPFFVEQNLDSERIVVRNLYGPTEDTTYSTVYKLEKGKKILIGTPIANTTAFLLSNSDDLVPIGVTGEICLSGEGLARGYLNRGDLTAEKFIPNKFSKEFGSRLYKTGDLGRWLDDGNIEYLGRIDNQVKIRGFRIELGEIEVAIAQSGFSKQTVVLAREGIDGVKRLTAYIVPEGDFKKEDLTLQLRKKLPEYMIPSIWIQLEKFPLTPNKKIDRKALPDTAIIEVPNKEDELPRDEVQRVLAQIWQELLGLKQVSINDNFFEVGGDSILTIQVVSRARRAGYELQPKDIFINQTIARISGVISKSPEAILSGEQGLLNGACELLPIQQWYLENQWKSVSHFNQSVLLGIDKRISPDLLSHVCNKLISQHDALRFKYFQKDGVWHQEYGTHSENLIIKDLRSVKVRQLAKVITQHSEVYQRSLNIGNGELVKMVLMQTPEAEKENRLLIVIHHLGVDGVSWRILIENLEYLITGFKQNESIELGIKSSSYRQWHEALRQYGQRSAALSQINYWEKVLSSYSPLSIYNASTEPPGLEDISTHTMNLDVNQTSRLLKEVPKVYGTEINDVLLCALSMTLSNCGGLNKITIGLEGHGREEIAKDIDTTRTVGWFTNLYPILIEINPQGSLGDKLNSVKDQLRMVPDKGLGFGILKYINKEKRLSKKAHWNVMFNYLGQLDTVVQSGKWISGAKESAGQKVSDEYLGKEHLTVNGSIKGGQLILSFRYNSKNYQKDSIIDLVKEYQKNLESLIDHCIKSGKQLAQSNFPPPEVKWTDGNVSGSGRSNNKYLVPIKVTGNKVPLYIVAGGGGTALKFMNFAKILNSDQPVYSLQPPLDVRDLHDFPDTIEEIAAKFLEEIMQDNPDGPFSLSGHCTGGFIALEMAKQLKAKGKKVHTLAMFDTIADKVNKNDLKDFKEPEKFAASIKKLLHKIKLKFDFEFFLFTKYTRKAFAYKLNSFKSLINKVNKPLNKNDFKTGGLEVLKYSEDHYANAHRMYNLLPYDEEIILFYAKERHFFTDAENNINFKKVTLSDEAKNRWSYYAKDIKIHELGGEHSTMFEPENAKEFASILQKYLNRNKNENLTANS